MFGTTGPDSVRRAEVVLAMFLLCGYAGDGFGPGHELLRGEVVLCTEVLLGLGELRQEILLPRSSSLGHALHGPLDDMKKDVVDEPFLIHDKLESRT